MAWLICKAIHNVENSLKKSHFQTKNILSEPRCLNRIVSVKMSHLKRRIQNDIQNVTFEMSHSKCLIRNVSLKMPHFNFLPENVSLKMSHKTVSLTMSNLKCLTHNVSLEMSHSKCVT